MLQTDPDFPDHGSFIIIPGAMCNLVSRTVLPRNMWALELGVKVQRPKVARYLFMSCGKRSKMRIDSNNTEMGCGIGSFWSHKDKDHF